MSASTQSGTAADMLNWMLVTRDGQAHAYARRLGIMYIIWNRQIWRAYRASEGWQPYSGTFSAPRNLGNAPGFRLMDI